jgi:hypothetical protein
VARHRIEAAMHFFMVKSLSVTFGWENHQKIDFFDIQLSAELWLHFEDAISLSTGLKYRRN